MRGLIAKKIGMTQTFNSFGTLIPVTVLQAGPCFVTQVKTEKIDGYDSIQLGFEDKKEKHSNQPLNGHFKKSNLTPKRILAEFLPVPNFDYKAGQKFGVSIFKKGEYVDIKGKTKGKGFSGVMKRHGFGGGPKTHGQREHPRSAGSIGQASDPSRVFKGIKMAGQYGNKNMTVKNLEVISIDKNKNIILVKGAVPGSNNGIVFISK
ncbi:MAG: 50S ribosomal protein L3 [Candidatus Marinimicrobia bacterium]|nr:50S ribosomal protein L3 [Candidatus Neomarinimicrobiota bacterium]